MFTLSCIERHEDANKLTNNLFCVVHLHDKPPATNCHKDFGVTCFINKQMSDVCTLY